MKTTVKGSLVVVAALLIYAGASPAANLHPIVEVESGFLFGAISDGKWIKADETAKLIGDETTYRVYGLTQALGDAKAGKPKPEGAPCDETLTVSLSPELEEGVIAIAAPWNALPRKPKVTDPTQKDYVDAVREFLETKDIKQPEVKIDNILRVDLDGDGEEEVLISDKLSRQEWPCTDEIAGWQLFDCACAASHRRQSGDPASRGRIPFEGLPG